MNNTKDNNDYRFIKEHKIFIIVAIILSLLFSSLVFYLGRYYYLSSSNDLKNKVTLANIGGVIEHQPEPDCNICHMKIPDGMKYKERAIFGHKPLHAPKHCTACHEPNPRPPSIINKRMYHKAKWNKDSLYDEQNK